MLLRSGFFLIFLLASSTGFSQYNQTARERKDSIRAEYIEDYPKDFAVWPMLKYRALTFSIEDGKQERPPIVFNPNNNLKLGAGFYLFDLSFEVSFAIPIAVRDESIYGKTKSTDLHLNLLTKSVSLDLYFQKYSGYYKDDGSVEIPGGEVYPQRPDITTRNLGFSAFYVWNNEKFSIRSSYNYADRQKKSAGSFILYGTVNSFKVDGDSSILSLPNQRELGEGSDFSHLLYTSMSIAPGYSYNLVLKRLFFNGTFALGPAHHWVFYQAEGIKGHYDILFNTAYTLRLAGGYSGNRFFTGAGLVLQTRAVRFENMRVESSSSVFRVVIGYRFREKGVMKERPLDIKM